MEARTTTTTTTTTTGKWATLAAAVFLMAAIMSMAALAATPDAPTSLTEGPIQRRANFPNNQSVVAYAGNVTELSITNEDLTKGWQGYYGDITGTIVLDDALNMSIFTWAVTPSGQLYAAWNATTPSWTSLRCLNASAPTGNDVTEAARMGIPSTADDNFTNTFNQPNAHPAFNVSTTNGFGANECQFNTQTYVNDSTPDGDPPRAFNETVLFDPTPANNFTVYMAHLNNNQYGFNRTLWDFQMLVPENGWNDNTASTTYYFYLELV